MGVSASDFSEAPVWFGLRHLNVVEMVRDDARVPAEIRAFSRDEHAKLPTNPGEALRLTHTERFNPIQLIH
jgi:hypothetical protein